MAPSLPKNGEKAADAFRTIGEQSAELGVAKHIWRYWETKFPQLRPLQRAGNRRYYRPADVELAQRINRLLNQEGYTVRGVQKVLRERSEPEAQRTAAPAPAQVVPAPADVADHDAAGVDIFRLIALRDRLTAALES